MKKIICLIDALGAGGAERQMAGLSSLLFRKGYTVEVWYFEPKHFFKKQIEEIGVVVKYFDYKKSKVNLYKRLKEELVNCNPEVVITYLQTSSILASIIKLFGGKYSLIISERNTNTSIRLRDIIRFNLYRVANYIVPNSFSQKNFIDRKFKFLSKKIHVIVNYVDTDFFVPSNHLKSNKILVVATIWPSKNTLGFIRSIKILKEKGLDFHVKWFGKVPDKTAYVIQCEELIKKLSLEREIELLNKISDIKEEYQKADYFCLPSFYEGTPNVLCEAMSCGLPILCSDVCDNQKYVENNTNGYLFNPNDPNDIATALEKILRLPVEEYNIMCENNRKKAIDVFSKDEFIYKYIELLES